MMELISSNKILERIEIAFWTISVRVMGNRKIFWCVVVLLLFLIISILTILFFKPGHVLKNSATDEEIKGAVQTINIESPPVQPTVITGQSNLLVILVDNLNSDQPHLLGLWLAGRVASAPQIIFLPIFPSSESADSDPIIGVFNLESDGRPGEKFLGLLRQKEIWWDHYLVADNTSLADLISLMDGVEWSEQVMTGPEMTALLSAANGQTQVALSMQAQIFSEFCSFAPDWAKKADTELFWSMFSDRFRSDFQLDTIRQAQQKIVEPEGMPVCEFPTLKGISQSWSPD